MRATFAIAALAGLAIAAPSRGNGRPQQNVHVVVETVIHTEYVTEGYEVTKPTGRPERPHYQAPPAVTSTTVYEAPKSSTKYEEPPKPTQTQEAPQPEPQPEEPQPEEPAPSPSPAPAPAPPASGGYMAVVDEWRAKLGLPKLEQSSELEANVLDCLKSSPGVMKHKLNPGSFGQVLAPGKFDTEGFTKVFVGGWLCEINTLPGLEGVCDTMSKGWAYEGQTGHAEILTSPNYSKIGCAVFGADDDSIVGCDVS